VLVGTFTFALMAIPLAADLLDRRRSEVDISWSDSFGLEEWRRWPAIGSVSALLLLATFGSGMGMLLIDPTKGSSSNLKLYDVGSSFTYGTNDSEGWMTVDDGQTVVWEFFPENEEVYNMTQVIINVYCSEGAQGLLTDQPDDFTIDVTPPSGFVADPEKSDPWTFDLTVGDQCDDGWSSFFANWTNINEQPGNDPIWAESSEEIFEEYADPTGSGMWSFAFTANTNGGVTPGVDDDANMMVQIDATVYGWELQVFESDS
jgi:hypothetical protein